MASPNQDKHFAAPCSWQFITHDGFSCNERSPHFCSSKLLRHIGFEFSCDLQAAISVASQQKISFSVIAQPYLPALQDIEMMKSLDRMNIPPLDWIIVADVDELYTYGSSAIGAAIAEMEAEGATFALAEMLDHVSSSGNITALTVGRSCPCRFYP